MITRLSRLLLVTVLIAMSAVLLYTCRSSRVDQAETISTGTPLEAVATWTAPAVQRTGSEASGVVSATPTGKAKLVRSMTPAPEIITVKIVGGNLFIRRGPSVDYNPIGFLSSGQSATATGRDRVRRWLLIESTGEGSPAGWVSILTEYTQVQGDVDRLALVTVEPARPAFIRNCTKHTVLVMPDQVQLLPRANAPYNEERFSPGEYLVYDLDVSDDVAIQEIELREGLSVEILVDGNGEKSKCY